MPRKPIEIKGFKPINGLYYPKVASKEYFFPKGAPVFNDRVYRIGRWIDDIPAGCFQGGKIHLSLIKPDEGIDLKVGTQFKRMASFDNHGVHRLLCGKILPLLIFPDTDLEKLT